MGAAMAVPARARASEASWLPACSWPACRSRSPPSPHLTRSSSRTSTPREPLRPRRAGQRVRHAVLLGVRRRSRHGALEVGWHERRDQARQGHQGRRRTQRRLGAAGDHELRAAWRSSAPTTTPIVDTSCGGRTAPSAGTRLVKDIDPSAGSEPGDFATVGGTLFFSASEPGGYGLWRSNGTKRRYEARQACSCRTAHQLGRHALLHGE